MKLLIEWGKDTIERHGLILATAGTGGTWVLFLQGAALMAAIVASLATAALALGTLYLRIKRRVKDDE